MMTDSTFPDDVTPVPDDRSDAPAQPAGDKPGAPGNAEPMTESTEGGLDGGDPGVEE
jgi:hypothetical protein